MMSVDDFTTMLAHLVRVAWAAAAGKLHLASAPDAADGDGETSRLQGGVCAMQKDVSSKVSSDWTGKRCTNVPSQQVVRLICYVR